MYINSLYHFTSHIESEPIQILSRHLSSVSSAENITAKPDIFLNAYKVQTLLSTHGRSERRLLHQMRKDVQDL